MFGSGNLGQMKIFSNSIAEPGKTPTTTQAEDSMRIVNGDSFWNRLKRKLSKKK